MKILILGATSQTGQVIIEQFNRNADFNISAYVRNPQKLTVQPDQITVGDMLDEITLVQAVKNQDVIIAGLSGQTILQQAQNLLTAAQNSSVKHIIWLTGMGIHHEITDAWGQRLNEFAQTMPEYIQAADLISKSSINSTLIRMPAITNELITDFDFTLEGIQPRSQEISRLGIAQALNEILTNLGDQKYQNTSLGLTN